MRVIACRGCGSTMIDCEHIRADGYEWDELVCLTCGARMPLVALTAAAPAHHMTGRTA